MELLDAIDDPVFIHDPETGEILDVNQAMCDQWGYSYDDACASTVADLSVSSQPLTERSYRELIQRAVTEGTQHIEWLFEAGDGEQFWAEVVLNRATIEGRKRVLAHVKIITEHKQTELRLDAFRQAVEHAGHSIYVTDSDGTILYVNRTFEEITGYTAQEALGQNPRILKSGVHDVRFYSQLWETILAGEVWRSELINETKDGSRYIVDQTIAPITDASGEISRFVAVNLTLN